MQVSILARSATAMALVAAPVGLSACGSRGPLDINVVEASDGGDASGNLDGTPDRVLDAMEASDDGMAEGGPIPCAMCIGQSCGTQLVQCLGSVGCRTALQCVAQMCFSGGTPDLLCAAGCAKGDSQTIQDLVGIFTCITMNCGPLCAGALGGSGDGGQATVPAPHVCDVFSGWQVCGAE